MPRQSVTLTESNNSWLNSHVENIGDYANKSELINDLIRRARRAEFINQKLSKAEKSNYLDQRIENVVKELDIMIYNNVCRGLFEKDKILFSFIMVISVLQSKDQLDFRLFNFFIGD